MAKRAVTEYFIWVCIIYDTHTLFCVLQRARTLSLPLAWAWRRYLLPIAFLSPGNINQKLLTHCHIFEYYYFSFVGHSRCCHASTSACVHQQQCTPHSFHASFVTWQRTEELPKHGCKLAAFSLLGIFPFLWTPKWEVGLYSGWPMFRKMWY